MAIHYTLGTPLAERGNKIFLSLLESFESYSLCLGEGHLKGCAAVTLV